MPKARVTSTRSDPTIPTSRTLYNKLAIVPRDRGQLEEAEAPHRRALAIYKHTRVLEHPDVAHPLYILANVLRDRGQLEDADALHRRLAIREHTRGPEHPDVADPFNNLAIVLRDRGQLEDADALHRRALIITESMAERPPVGG